MIEEQRWAARAGNNVGSRCSRGRRRRASCALSATAAGGVPSSAWSWRRTCAARGRTHSRTPQDRAVNASTRCGRRGARGSSRRRSSSRGEFIHHAPTTASTRARPSDALRDADADTQLHSTPPNLESNPTSPSPCLHPALRRARSDRPRGGRMGGVRRAGLTTGLVHTSRQLWPWRLRAWHPDRLRPGSSCPSSSSVAPPHIGIHIRHPRRTCTSTIRLQGRLPQTS